MDDIKMVLWEAALYSMDGEDPTKALDDQVKRGQKEVIRNSKLPMKTNEHSVPRECRLNGVEDEMNYTEQKQIISNNNVKYTKNQYELMGIKVTDDNDGLCCQVALPEGWTVKSSDMYWSDVFDHEGKQRANFFYKSAFYNAEAFINFDTRYKRRVEHTVPNDDYEIECKSPLKGLIYDGKTVIFSTDEYAITGEYIKDDVIESDIFDTLTRYLERYFPDYQDINAYWDWY